MFNALRHIGIPTTTTTSNNIFFIVSTDLRIDDLCLRC